jgi:AraC-like DNA-binding protein
VPALFQPFPMLAGRRAQVWRHQPAFRRPRHFHDEPELNLVVAGRGVLGVGAHVIEVSAGQVLLFHPGQDHVLLDSSDDLELFVVALSPELAERGVGLRALASSRSAALAEPELSATASELAALEQVSDGAVVEGRLVGVFARALKTLPRTHVLSRRALETARREPALPNGALARRLDTDPTSLSRRFHAEVGVPLVEYRARLKLMRFIELVDQGRGLSRAALDAEFGSYAQCHRVFRRALGCSPRAYFAGRRRLVDAETL